MSARRPVAEWTADDRRNFIHCCQIEATLRSARGGADDKLFADLYGVMADLATEITEVKEQNDRCRIALDIACGIFAALLARDVVTDGRLRLAMTAAKEGER